MMKLNAVKLTHSTLVTSAAAPDIECAIIAIATKNTIDLLIVTVALIKHL